MPNILAGLVCIAPEYEGWTYLAGILKLALVQEEEIPWSYKSCDKQQGQSGDLQEMWTENFTNHSNSFFFFFLFSTKCQSTTDSSPVASHDVVRGVQWEVAKTVHLYNDVIWLQLPECFEASCYIQIFFFCEESLVRDINDNKDCSEMHSGSCSQMTSSCKYNSKKRQTEVNGIKQWNLPVRMKRKAE